jgi:LytS/YehU family sensor histidine kinase
MGQAMLNDNIILVKYSFHHPYVGFLELFPGDMSFFLAGAVLGMLLKLISTSIQKELQDGEGKAEQNQGGFNLLQSQLSPRFLFNVMLILAVPDGKSFMISN